LNHFIAVTFPDAGLTYELSLEALARVGGADMADAAKVPSLVGNLPWATVRPCARLIGYQRPRPHRPAVWSEGYEQPRPAVLPADSADHGIVPLDLHLSVMWEKNAAISAHVFVDSTDQPSGVMIFVAGNKLEIDAYLSAVAQTCRRLAEPSSPPPAPPPGGRKPPKRATRLTSVKH
jgi:hypothetical protein